MIKTFQKKVIITAMTAITILLAVFIGAINIANYIALDNQSDRILERVTRDEGMFLMRGRHPGEERNFPFPPVSKDMAMAARYFTVRFDENGEIVHTHIGRISSVTEAQANALAQKAYEEGEISGTKEKFKYRLVTTKNGGQVIIFMDNSMSRNNIMFVLVISLLIGGVCWLLMLLLVILLSKKAVNPIAQNMERQKQFVTNAGHEIKTPLAIIMSNTEALELYNGENKWSKNIRTQVLRLSELMKNLLTLAKMDEEGIKLDCSKFCISTSVSEMIDSFREVAADKNIEINSAIEPDVEIIANKESMVQLVSILLDNAVKYTPQVGMVDVRVAKEHHSVIMKFKNTIEGITEENPEKFFERFYRGDSARTQKNGGCGIGLSAARAIAQANNSTIFAEYQGDMIVFTVRIKNVN